MRSLRIQNLVLAGLVAWLLLVAALPAAAQGPSGATARVRVADSALTATPDGVMLRLALSQPVPYRVRLLPAPPRAVIEFNTLDWQGLDWAPPEGLRGVRLGYRRDGWARLVLDLGQPMRPETVAQTVAPDTGRATITAHFVNSTRAAFEDAAVDEAGFAARTSGALLHPDTAAPAGPADDVLRVVLDPGHGGVDPGAVRDGVTEAGIALSYARALRDALRRRDGIAVTLTRDRDEFVSLDGRLRAAREARAELFVSLHADALPEGRARGAAVYTLSDEASDGTAALLAARHDRADLLAGADLSGTDDEIARVLMSVVWPDTAARNRALSDALIGAIGAAGLDLHAKPQQRAAFTVLRVPDVPAALVELGFMSSPRDLARLRDPDWRARMVAALADGIGAWHRADATR